VTPRAPAAPATGQEALAAAVARLRAAGVPEPAGDARRLLAQAAGVEPGRLTLMIPEPLAPDAAAQFERYVALRARRMPVSRIVGRRAFYGRSFLTDPEVLDPRPETETLVEAALSEPFSRMLDLGTGSGCILVSCLAERPAATGLGTDISEAALLTAAANAERHGVSARAAFVRADWLEGLEGRFDLVVSNPPYIAEAELAGLAPEVRDHDPRHALTPGGDGLGAYREIARGLPGHLAPGARCLLEIGPGQGPQVAALLAAAGLEEIRTIRDLDGRPRVVIGRRAP
jgi:release factor glutamine methyltransferase